MQCVRQENQMQSHGKKMLPCMQFKESSYTSQSQPTLSFHAQSSDEVKRTDIELILMPFTNYNVPLAFHNRLSPTIRKVIADSKLHPSITQPQQKQPVGPTKLWHQC